MIENIDRLRLSLLTLTFIFLPFISSCSYDKTVLTVGSTFESTWSFNDSSLYEFNSDQAEIVNGQVKLVPLALNFNGESLSQGKFEGAYYSASDRKLKIISTTSESLDLRNLLEGKLSHLQAYYQMEGDLLNSASSSHHGTFEVGSASFTTENKKLGERSLQLNTNAVLIGNPIDTGGGLPFSVMGWFSASSVNTVDYARLFDDTASDGAGRQGSTCWVRDYVTSQRLICELFNDGSAVTLSYESLVTQLYHHFVLTSDGSQASLWVNGVLIEQKPYSSKNGVGNMRLGAGQALTNHFDGYIDEFAFLSINLTPQEIKKIYETQSLNYQSLSEGWTPQYDSLVGYWKLDANYLDSSGSGVHGAAAGDASFSGSAKVGSHAGIFDGAGDFMSAVDNDVIEPANISISSWFKVVDASGNGNIFSKGHNLGYRMRVNGGTQIIRFFDRGGLNILDSVSSVNLNEWTHVVVTGSSLGLKMYVNGKLDASNSNPYGSPNNSLEFWIGANSSLTEFFNGSVDEVAIWSEVLSAADVQKIYDRQKQKFMGSYESEVIDVASLNWPGVGWSTPLPFGKGVIGSSESLADYPDLLGDLSLGLEGLWHFDEDFNDFSGNSRHGAIVGVGGYSLEAVLGKSYDDTGTGVYGRVLNFPGPSDLSVAFWVKNKNPVTSGNYLRLLASSIGWRIRDDGTGRLRIEVHTSSATAIEFSNKVVGDGEFHHVYLELVDGNARLFVDGILDKSFAYLEGGGLANTSTFVVGEGDFHGNFDELALWNRALSDDEIKQLYQRTASRVRLQVKTCVDTGCACKSFSLTPSGSATDCDGDGVLNSNDSDDAYRSVFVGPGGGVSTYFSELYNRPSSGLTFNCALNTSDNDIGVCVEDEVTTTGDFKITGPSYDNTSYTQFINTPSQRYLQYRVTLQALANSACDGEPCWPEFSSMSFNPQGVVRYANEPVEVVPKEQITFKSLRSISIQAEPCASFRLQRGSTQYYHDSSSWVEATPLSPTNSESELEANFLQFADQFGPGQLGVISYISSDATQSTNCTVEAIDLLYESL